MSLIAFCCASLATKKQSLFSATGSGIWAARALLSLPFSRLSVNLSHAARIFSGVNGITSNEVITAALSSFSSDFETTAAGFTSAFSASLIETVASAGSFFTGSSCFLTSLFSGTSICFSAMGSLFFLLCWQVATVPIQHEVVSKLPFYIRSRSDYI